VGKQVQLLVETEHVNDLIIELLDVEDIEVEIDERNVPFPDESKQHPSYALTPSDVTTIIIAFAGVIHGLTPLVKVILDYKLKIEHLKIASKPSQNVPAWKQGQKVPAIVVDDQVTPLSDFNTPEELTKFLEDKMK
jgi:hypothetical protein